jgi:hypothetical protein
MINPLDRLPLALEAAKDFVITFLMKKIGWLILLIAAAGAILWFADTRDFMIVCDEYSIDSGISCPLK